MTRQRDSDAAAGLEGLARLNNELVNLQRQLAKQNGALQRLNREKDTLLGMAAHDLRNPISAIKGQAQLLAEAELEPQQTAAALASIVRSAEHMLQLVDDLLDVSVIESGRLELRAARTSLSAMLERRLQFFGAIAARKSIALVTDVPAGLAAELDPHRFEQVVDNLVSNAIKYSPPGGRVWVSAGVRGETLRVAVRDEGPGLDEADRRRLFGAFSRLAPRPTGGERSTGLGLAICKRIISAHGGTIEVDSAPGRGSTFTVVQPLSQPTISAAVGPDAAAEPKPAGADRAAAGALRRVLLVDDDDELRAINEIALAERGGLEVRGCASAEEALAALRAFAADLVLLDVELPQMDGPATLAALRADPRTARLPVVFFTARSEPDVLERLEQLGAAAVLTKTITPGELPAALQRIWRRRS